MKKTHPMLPKRLLISGGRQRVEGYEVKEWSGYDLAVALELNSDTAASKVVKTINYVTPKDCMAEDTNASITFKAGSIFANELWLSTQTEAVKFDLESLEKKQQISHPVFNDVHHVMVSSKNTLVVTSTGLDAVFELTREGEVISEWSCNEKPIWNKFDKNTDYRKVLTTKPHAVHPNFCLEYEGNYWATRLKQMDCFCLQTGETISLGDTLIHDGLVVDNLAYFTHVNGKISIVDLNAKKLVEKIDLNPLNKSGKQIGWCRGFHFIDENHFLIGFTRIRPSKYHQGLEWLKSKLNTSGWRGCLPTRICLLNRQTMEFEWEFNLEDHQINAVFSIL